MDRADNTKCRRTAANSGSHELDRRDAVRTVARDQVVVLRPQDTQNIIGAQHYGSYCCIVLIGTSSRPAIMMAQICTSNGEEHYMSLVRLMIGIFMKEQELFQLPRAWGIFSHGQKGDPQINLLTQRTETVFRHLHVQLEIAFRASLPAEVMHSPYNQLAVVAVRHEPGLPEIYVGNCLLYPRVHPGSLALTYDRLGVRQVDYEHDVGEKSGGEGETLE